jgi:hypothetical protein
MFLTDIAKLHVLPPHRLEHDLSHADDRDLFLSLTEVIMSMTDIERLRVLLPHWLEHNAAHADDYRAWIERLAAAGEPDAAEHLAAAIEKLAGVNRDLETLLAHLGGSLEAGEHSHHHNAHDHHHHDG